MKKQKPPQKIPIAKKHPMYYLLHKYWARKPHNIVHDYIDFFTKEGEVVMDPFGGSGVTAIESIRSGRKAINVDINPISEHIIGGTCIPISVRDFEERIKKIEKKVTPLLEELYRFSCIKCKKNVVIDHTVWSQLIDCESCNKSFPCLKAKKVKRNYSCINCGHLNKAKYSINRKEVPIEIKFHCNNCEKTFKHELTKNEMKSILKNEKNFEPINFRGKLIYNPRTLVEKNMKVSNLFTKRNLAIIKEIKKEIKKIPNADLRKIMSFVFTSSIAQSSRLIAYRGGLTTGGPAWTISGFWLPPISMEINPLNNFRNKARKIKIGKSRLNQTFDELGIPNLQIIKNQKDLSKNKILSLNKSINEINNKDIKSNSVDYIFTDPPYGDSVPYLEYSALWASCIDEKLDYENEIIISDSPDRKKTLENYEKLISEAFSNCYRILKEDSWLSVTFHNRFLETWKVLLESIDKAGFSYISADYLIPAVIPAKAQLSEGSLEGDIVMHYRKISKKPSKKFTEKNFEPILKKRVKDVISFMDGKARMNQVWNSIIFLILENQYNEIPYKEIKKNILKNFKIKDGFVIDSKNKKKTKTLSNVVKKICKNNKIDDKQILLSKIYEEIPIWLAPPISEVKEKMKKYEKKSNSSLEEFL